MLRSISDRAPRVAGLPVRIQTGSYTNRDGQKVYTTDVVVDDQEFADSKKQHPAAMNGGYGN